MISLTTELSWEQGAKNEMHYSLITSKRIWNGLNLISLWGTVGLYGKLWIICLRPLQKVLYIQGGERGHFSLFSGFRLVWSLAQIYKCTCLELEKVVGWNFSEHSPSQTFQNSFIIFSLSSCAFYIRLFTFWNTLCQSSKRRQTSSAPGP